MLFDVYAALDIKDVNLNFTVQTLKSNDV